MQSKDIFSKLKLKFTLEQLEMLQKYSDAQLLAADKICAEKKEARDKTPLFFWLLRNDANVIHADENLHKESREFKQTIHPPKPWISKSYDENIIRFAKWYEQYGDSYCQQFHYTKHNLKQIFIDQLNKLFSNPNNLHNWRMKSKEFWDILQKYKPTDFKEDDQIQLKIHQNISNDINVTNIKVDESRSNMFKSDHSLFDFEEVL